MGSNFRGGGLTVAPEAPPRLEPMDDPWALGLAPKGADLWRYRAGEYRIVASIEDEKIRNLVLRIGHRREVCRGWGEFIDQSEAAWFG